MVAQRMSSQEIKSNWPWDTRSVYSHFKFSLNFRGITRISDNFGNKFHWYLPFGSWAKETFVLYGLCIHSLYSYLAKKKKSTAGDGKEVPFSSLGWIFVWVIFLEVTLEATQALGDTEYAHETVYTVMQWYNIGHRTSRWRYLNTGHNSVSNSSQFADRRLFIQNANATEIKGNQL